MSNESMPSNVVVRPIGRGIYTFEAEHGTLDATYRQEVGWFCISNVNVEPRYRRNGLGKILLQSAFTEARRLGAGLVYAAITSRECLDVMSDVFGEDSIRVEQEGTYTPEGLPDRYDAEAILLLDLK